MSFWLSRWLTRAVALSSVVCEVVVGGSVAVSPFRRSSMKWLNTCSTAATLGISSVFFYFGGTLPSWMASLTSVTNVSIVSRIKTFPFASKVNLVLSSMSSILANTVSKS